MDKITFKNNFIGKGVVVKVYQQDYETFVDLIEEFSFYTIKPTIKENTEYYLFKVVEDKNLLGVACSIKTLVVFNKDLKPTSYDIPDCYFDGIKSADSYKVESEISVEYIPNSTKFLGNNIQNLSDNIIFNKSQKLSNIDNYFAKMLLIYKESKREVLVLEDIRNEIIKILKEF